MDEIVNPSMDNYALGKRAAENLARRLSPSGQYRPDEIEDIEAIDPRLIPHDVTLDLPTQERLRALARLSRVSLSDFSRISSHRKVIGPIIVFLKKLTWPFIRAQLKGPLEGLEEFNSLMLETVTIECVERERLKRSVK